MRTTRPAATPVQWSGILSTYGSGLNEAEPRLFTSDKM
jgi:hypothetical protein